MLKIFNKYKDEIINEFGIKPMYEDQINKYGYKHLKHFGGVYPHDKFKPEDNKCYIINTGNHNSVGYHWVACYIKPTHLFLFDSFHREPHKIIHDIDKIAGRRQIVVSSWPEAIQKDYLEKEENICGQLSLAWLRCVNDYGIYNAILI